MCTRFDCFQRSHHFHTFIVVFGALMLLSAPLVAFVCFTIGRDAEKNDKMIQQKDVEVTNDEFEIIKELGKPFENCDIKVLVSLPQTIIGYCSEKKSKIESLAVFDKLTTKHIFWSDNKLAKMRNFLRSCFQPNGRCDVRKNSESYVRLSYDINDKLLYGIVADKLILSPVAVSAIYKILC